MSQDSEIPSHHRLRLGLYRWSTCGLSIIRSGGAKGCAVWSVPGHFLRANLAFRGQIGRRILRHQRVTPRDAERLIYKLSWKGSTYGLARLEFLNNLDRSIRFSWSHDTRPENEVQDVSRLITKGSALGLHGTIFSNLIGSRCWAYMPRLHLLNLSSRLHGPRPKVNSHDFTQEKVRTKAWVVVLFLLAAMDSKPLVPRSTRHVAPAVPEPQAMPTHGEWAAMYPDIERLYVRERRKLRHVVQVMQQKHGFKAT